MSILKLTKVPAILAAAALSAAVPAKAVAQGVDLVPWAGAYIPTRNSVSDLDNALSRDVSVVGGARLTFWGSGHLGLEAVGGYAPAKISGETINETNQNMLLAAGRLMLALSPADSRVGFFIAGGPALITRGKNPFDDDRSSTDFGANVGAEQLHRDPAGPRRLHVQRRLRRRRQVPERPGRLDRTRDPARRAQQQRPVASAGDATTKGTPKGGPFSFLRPPGRKEMGNVGRSTRFPQNMHISTANNPLKCHRRWYLTKLVCISSRI